MEEKNKEIETLNLEKELSKATKQIEDLWSETKQTSQYTINHLLFFNTMSRASFKTSNGEDTMLGARYLHPNVFNELFMGPSHGTKWTNPQEAQPFNEMWQTIWPSGDGEILAEQLVGIVLASHNIALTLDSTREESSSTKTLSEIINFSHKQIMKSLDNLKNKYPEKAIIFDDFINTFLPNTNFWKLIAQPIDSDTAYQLTSTEILTKFLEKNQTSSESPVLN